MTTIPLVHSSPNLPGYAAPVPQVTGDAAYDRWLQDATRELCDLLTESFREQRLKSERRDKAIRALDRKLRLRFEELHRHTIATGEKGLRPEADTVEGIWLDVHEIVIEAELG